MSLCYYLVPITPYKNFFNAPQGAAVRRALFASDIQSPDFVKAQHQVQGLGVGGFEEDDRGGAQSGDRPGPQGCQKCK